MLILSPNMETLWADWQYSGPQTSPIHSPTSNSFFACNQRKMKKQAKASPHLPHHLWKCNLQNWKLLFKSHPISLSLSNTHSSCDLLFTSPKMEAERSFLLIMAVAAMVVTVGGQGSGTKPLVKVLKGGLKVCDKGWECKGWSKYCCNQTVSDFFQTYQFENLFAKRNTPVAHAVGFWDYRSFITAAAVYQPHGFGTAGGKLMQMKEVAAFLGHVGSKTTCKPIPSFYFLFSLFWCLVAVKMQERKKDWMGLEWNWGFYSYGGLGWTGLGGVWGVN